MELNEYKIKIIQEAINSYKNTLSKELELLDTENPANKDKAISLRCKNKDLEEATEYLNSKLEASKDKQLEAKQLREAVESLLIQVDNNHLEQIEAQAVSNELEKTALKIIEYIGLNIPATRYMDLYRNKQ